LRSILADASRLASLAPQHEGFWESDSI